MGQVQSSIKNIQATKAFRAFLDKNGIHYTPQEGKYGGNPENSQIIEINNPTQKKLIDSYLQKNTPQAENILVKHGLAIRYDPRTFEAHGVDITNKNLGVDESVPDFYSKVAGKKYSFPLYSDAEKPLSKSDFMKLYIK